jgi:hypothetical protein
MELEGRPVFAPSFGGVPGYQTTRSLRELDYTEFEAKL